MDFCYSVLISSTFLDHSVFVTAVIAFGLRLASVILCGLLSDGSRTLRSTAWIVLTSIDLGFLLVSLLAYLTTICDNYDQRRVRMVQESEERERLAQRQQRRGLGQVDSAGTLDSLSSQSQRQGLPVPFPNGSGADGAEPLDAAHVEMEQVNSAAVRAANDSPVLEPPQVFGNPTQPTRCSFPAYTPGGISSPLLRHRIFPFLLMICNTFLLITTVILVTTNASHLLTGDMTHQQFSERSKIVICEAIGAAFSCLFFVLFVTDELRFFAMKSRSVVLLSSVLMLEVAFVCIWLHSTEFNKDIAAIGPVVVAEITHNAQAFPYYALVMAMTGAAGLVISCCIDEYNRLSDLSGNFTAMHIIVCLACEIICMVYFGFACANIKVSMNYGYRFRDITVADPIISFAAMILALVSILGLNSMRTQPDSHLAVEYYDLNGLSEEELALWASIIDNYSHVMPGAPSGRHALSMMQAYTATTADNMRCKVLRVYDKRRARELDEEAAEAAAAAATGEPLPLKKRHKGLPDASSSASHESSGEHMAAAGLEDDYDDETGVRSYEKIQAWEPLDKVDIFDEDASMSSSHAPVEDFVAQLDKAQEEAQAAEKTSRRAQRRAEWKAAKKAKAKAAKAAAKQNNNNTDNNNNNDNNNGNGGGKKGRGNKQAPPPQEQQEDDAADDDAEPEEEAAPDAAVAAEKKRKMDEFKRVLLTTEALALLTFLEDLDLTALNEDTAFSRLGSKMFGKNSCCKALCMRFGLLAVHFPWRQFVVYTGPTKKPNARTAAVVGAIGKWNSKLGSDEHCKMIATPVIPHRGGGDPYHRGLSGWQPVPMPASHVVDLRAHRGKTLQEYLKAIKYRNQAPAFNKANGKVEETATFTLENCKVATDLWANIADKRVGEGHTGVLVRPTPEFLMSLGSVANEKGYRSLLFLSVDGKTIASSVLFRLGDTITSDIQGLDHENGRQYKAYFVMMQETIAIALREGISFVDFGPTTSQPKIDIGAQVVPITGGMWAEQPLAFLSSLFADQVE